MRLEIESFLDSVRSRNAPQVTVNPQGQPPGLAFTKPPIQPGEPLRLEIESFLQSVRSRNPPQVTGKDGRAALALALEINAAIAAHSAQAGLDRFQP